MAFAKKCDICGVMFDYKKSVKVNHIKLGDLDIWHGREPTYFGREAYDCCPDCVDAIKNVIEERKAKKK